MINVNTVVNAQSPADAVELLLTKGLNINKKEWPIQLDSYKEYNTFHTNVAVTKLDGIKRVSYYELSILPTATRKERNRINNSQADWARREQVQGWY